MLNVRTYVRIRCKLLPVVIVVVAAIVVASHDFLMFCWTLLFDGLRVDRLRVFGFDCSATDCVRLSPWELVLLCKLPTVSCGCTHSQSTKKKKEKEQQKIQLDSSANNVAFFSEFSLNALE